LAQALRIVTMHDSPVVCFRHDDAEQLAKQGLTATMRCVGWSKNGQWICTASEDCSGRIFDVQSGVEFANYKHEACVRSVCFSPDERWLCTACDDMAARVFALQLGETPARDPIVASTALVVLRHPKVVMHVCFNPEGSMLCTCCKDKNARIYRKGETAEQWCEIHNFNHGNMVICANFSSDGKYLCTGCGFGIMGLAHVYNVETALEVATFGHGDWVTSVSFSADGTRIVTSSRDKFARVLDIFEVEQEPWEPPTEREIKKLKRRGLPIPQKPEYKERKELRESQKICHGNHVSAAGFSPDGSRICTACDDGNVRIYDTKYGLELYCHSHHERVCFASLRECAGKGNSLQLLTACRDGGARIIDLATVDLSDTAVAVARETARLKALEEEQEEELRRRSTESDAASDE